MVGKQFWRENYFGGKKFCFGKKTILAGKLFWQENYFGEKTILVLFPLTDLIKKPRKEFTMLLKSKILLSFHISQIYFGNLQNTLLLNLIFFSTITYCICFRAQFFTFLSNIVGLLKKCIKYYLIFMHTPV